MRLFSLDGSGVRRQSLLLAPRSLNLGPFTNIVADYSIHRDRLAEAQKLRGRIFLEIGAVDPSQLSEDGRHIEAPDDQSWHLLTLDADERVVSCARYLPHGREVRFDDLAVSRGSLAKSQNWGEALRTAVEADLREARRRGCSYIEVGGWAIAEALRCTTEALRTIATAYAFAQLCGGGLGITTANTRSCSAAILKRVGGQPLRHGGAELPVYYDEHYHKELEILRFDAFRPNPRYQKWIEACRSHLRNVPVICREAPVQAIAFSRRPPAINLRPLPEMAV